METDRTILPLSEAHKAILTEATERFSPYREAEGLRHAFIQGAKWMLDRKEQVTDEMVERACAAHWKARTGEHPGALWTDESIRRPEWGQAYREDMRSALEAASLRATFQSENEVIERVAAEAEKRGGAEVSFIYDPAGWWSECLIEYKDGTREWAGGGGTMLGALAAALDPVEAADGK